MGKAKIASKNNPEGRGQAKEYFHSGKKIKPVKLITENRSFFAAEYDESGDLVLGSDGRALPWANAKQIG
jgi:antitoxin component YwqK of YwqJK toxin-antitoxin module